MSCAALRSAGAVLCGAVRQERCVLCYVARRWMGWTCSLLAAASVIMRVNHNSTHDDNDRSAHWSECVHVSGSRSRCGPARRALRQSLEPMARAVRLHHNDNINNSKPPPPPPQRRRQITTTNTINNNDNRWLTPYGSIATNLCQRVDRAAVMQRARGATCDRQRAPCDSTWLHVTVACNVVLERRGTHPHGACSQVPCCAQRTGSVRFAMAHINTRVVRRRWGAVPVCIERRAHTALRHSSEARVPGCALHGVWVIVCVGSASLLRYGEAFSYQEYQVPRLLFSSS